MQAAFIPFHEQVLSGGATIGAPRHEDARCSEFLLRNSRVAFLQKVSISVPSGLVVFTHDESERVQVEDVATPVAPMPQLLENNRLRLAKWIQNLNPAPNGSEAGFFQDPL